MATIITRAGKGSPLTNAEVDANFTNLNTELAGKALTSSLSLVATSGAYADLTGRPTAVSAFTNDAGYLTTETDPTVPSHVKSITTTNISNWNSAFSWGNHASAGYLTGITSGQVTTALGFTPYNATNPAGYISGINSSMVATALGYTPANRAGDTFTGAVQAPDFRAASGSIFYLTGDQFSFRTTGGSQRLSINSAGNVTANVDFRAPTFYDSDNTGFYVDASGTSNLSGLTVASRINGGINGDARLLYSDTGTNGGGLQYWNILNNSTLNPDNAWYYGLRMAHGDADTYYNATLVVPFFGDDLYLRRTVNGTAQTWRRFWHNGDATISASGDFRAPIFYDSNNTSYYLDPASSSVLGIVSLFSSNDAQLYLNGNGTRWAGIQWTDDVGTDNMWFNGATSTFAIGGGGSQVANKKLHVNGGTTIGSGLASTSVSTNGLLVETRVDAPIYYDSNNTGNYLDPAGTSQLVTVQTSGGSGFRSFATPSASITSQLYFANTDNTRAWNWQLDENNNAALWGYNGSAWQKRFTVNQNGSAIAAASLNISGGGTYQPGSIYSDGNWGMIFRAFQASPNQADFLWTNSADSERLRISTAGSLISPFDMRAPIFYDSNNTAFYVDPASTSVLSGLTVNGGATYRSDWTTRFQSSSDFVSGTLVSTDIPATGWAGDSFIIEITGKSYDGSNPPFKAVAQGYLYNDTIINFSGINYGGSFSSFIRVFQDGGVLKFWWPRISYWNSFNVNVMSMDGPTNGTITRNRVTSITDSAEPTGTKKQTITLNQALRENTWINNKYFGSDGAIYGTIFYDSNNTAFYVDPNGGSRMNTIQADEVFAFGWFRNNNSGSGFYNQATGQHFYSDSASGWNIAGGGSNNWLRFRDTNGGTVRGYVYADNSNNIGFLNSIGNWCLQVVGNDWVLVPGTSIRAPLFYDSNNTAFYLDPASTSRVNAIDFGQAGHYIHSVGDWGFRSTTPHGWIQFGPANAGHAHIYTDRSNFYFNAQLVVNGGSTINTNDIRSPIFYDSNNTGYYVDPDSWSVLLNVQASTIRFASTASTAINLTSGTYNILCDPGGRNALFLGGAGDPANYYDNDAHNFRNRAGGQYATIAASGMFAPAFYDYANTAFYVDPASTSALNVIDVGGRIDLWRNIRSVNAAQNGWNTTLDWNSGNTIIYAGDSFRAPIFYDSQDTSYYVDPHQTSRFSYISVVNNSALTSLETGGVGRSTPLTAIGGNIGSTMPTWFNAQLELRNTDAGWVGIAFHRAGYTSASLFSTGSNLQSNLAFYAPIYYDYDNSAFYLDPNSTGTSLNVAGTIVAAGNVTAYSDIRVKDNVEQIGGALERISAIRGVTYTRNDLDDKERRYAGVIAQEIEAVLPEAVFDRGDKKSVDYNATIGLLIEAIKELKYEVETLKKDLH